jgi:hypothetical protein
MRRSVVLMVALTSCVLGALAACGSGTDSHGSMDASLPADGPLALDAHGAPEGNVVAEAGADTEAGVGEGGDAEPDTLVGDDASDVAADASVDASNTVAASDALSPLCPTACDDAADAACATPDVAGNPPAPTGYQPLPQAQVTSAMTTWAVGILHDPSTYPMFSCTVETFGSLTVLARAEWLPPDFQTSVVHRGVVLFEPGD